MSYAKSNESCYNKSNYTNSRMNVCSLICALTRRSVQYMPLEVLLIVINCSVHNIRRDSYGN